MMPVTMPWSHDKFPEYLMACRELLEEQSHRDLPRAEELYEMAYCCLAMSNALNPYCDGRAQSSTNAETLYAAYKRAKVRRIARL
jgi:hypothetical protein